MNNKFLRLKIVLIAFVVVVIVPIFSITKAEAITAVDTTAATGIGATIDSAPATNPATIRDRIKADLDAKLQNAKNNQEIRNQMLEKERLASTSPRNIIPKKPDARMVNPVGNRIENRVENRPASTSPKLKRDGYENNGKAMMINILKERKELVAKQLNVAIQNLTELRKRVGSRIEKDRMSGKDVTTVTELLKTADSKITLAKESIAKLRSYVPTASNIATSTSTTTGTSTNAVDLGQVRLLIDNAQKAIKEAHRALTDVVVAIAKISGNNLQKKATTTNSTNI